MPTAPAPLGPEATRNSSRSGSRSKRAMDAGSASKRRTVASTIDWRRRTSTSGWKRLATTPRRAASRMVSSAALMVGSVESLEGGPIDQRPAVMRRLSILCRRVDACDVALADGGRLGDLGDVTLGVFALGLGDLRHLGDLGHLGDVTLGVVTLDLGDLRDLGDVTLGVVVVDLGNLGNLGDALVRSAAGHLVPLFPFGVVVYPLSAGFDVGSVRLGCKCPQRVCDMGVVKLPTWPHSAS